MERWHFAFCSDRHSAKERKLAYFVMLAPVELFAQAGAAPGGGSSWIEVAFSGGPLGVAVIVILIGLSITALALAVNHWLTIRTGALMPEGLAEQVLERLSQGDLSAARQACDANPSFLGFTIRPALAEVEGGWAAGGEGGGAGVKTPLEAAPADQAARLYRKVEYLSVIANLATMLGLLGTV